MTHPQLEATKFEWQIANTPFANHQEYMKTRLHVSMQNCQSIREHQFEFANSKERHAKMTERSKQPGAPRILTEVNYY